MKGVTSPRILFDHLIHDLQSEHSRVLQKCECLLRENVRLKARWTDFTEQELQSADQGGELDPDSWHKSLPAEASLPCVCSAPDATEIRIGPAYLVTTPREYLCTTPGDPAASPRTPIQRAASPTAKSNVGTHGKISDETAAIDQFQPSPSAASESNAKHAAKSGICHPSASRNVIHGSFDSWQRRLINVFQELDGDGSGSLSMNELRMGLKDAGIPLARLTKLLRLADLDRSGEIDLHEWVRAVKEFHEFRKMNSNLVDRLESTGLVSAFNLHQRCIILPDSRVRVYSGVVLAIACIYVGLVLPFVVAWDNLVCQQATDFFKVVDRCILGIFILDIVLNFRTAYYDLDGELITDSRRIAKRYLITWFLLDLIASFPFEDVAPTLGPFKPSVLKGFKMGKLAKMLTLMKPPTSSILDLSDVLDDIAHSKVFRVFSRKYFVMLQALLICHWLACTMKFFDEGFLNNYQNVGGRLWPEYLAAVYWAMTTLTTVGYGDITPTSDGERAITLAAMVVGGAFYGYVVGSISSLVANGDLNTSTYYDRMDMIYAWLAHHHMPQEMKRSLRRYFESSLQEKSALKEAEIWPELTPELQIAVGEFIIHEHVRFNPLFDGISMRSFVQLQSILRKFTLQAGGTVTRKGEVGSAMYIVLSGMLQMDEDGKVSNLGPGQSFGEEVLLGFQSSYEYTVTVIERVKLEMIMEGEFLQAFQNCPNELQRMRDNAAEANPQLKLLLDSGSPSMNPAISKDTMVSTRSGSQSSQSDVIKHHTSVHSFSEARSHHF